MAESEIRKRTAAEALRAAAQQLNAHPERYTVPMVSLLLFTLAEIVDDPTLLARNCGHSPFWFAGPDCMVCGPTGRSATTQRGT